MKYLVIAESPAKKTKISKFLNSIPGHEFIVDASFGHIRYFKNGLKSIDFDDNYKPTYGIISSKSKVVSNLKKLIFVGIFFSLFNQLNILSCDYFHVLTQQLSL